MYTEFANAIWIGSGQRVVNKTTGEISPAVQLRREFSLETTKNASLRICGLGLFTLYINGKQVGDEVLRPAFTDYDKRVLYCEYQVAEYLRCGQNVICIKLGDGFYNQTTRDDWTFYAASWRDKPKCICMLAVDDVPVLVSDKSWKCSLEGPTIHNSIRTGEIYDARKEDGWKQMPYNDSKWNFARTVAPPAGVLVRSELPPIRECEEIECIRSWKSAHGRIYDFGKNISGYISFRMRGEWGQEISIKYAEMLEDTEVSQSNISCYVSTDDFSVDKYIFRGEGEESWRPEFVYHGFRYVELLGTDEEPLELKAHFVHTDLQKKGNLYTSDGLLNWIYDAGIRSFLSNFHGFSEDCPHREKNGWTGDAAISVGYAVHQFHMNKAYQKWLQDIVDTQRLNGQICAIAPTSGWGYNWGSGPAWDCALFFIPYELYLETGDMSCIDIVYEAGVRYLEYANWYREDGLVCYGLSDWCPPKLSDYVKMSNQLSDSCYYYAMQMIMAKMSELKGNTSAVNVYMKAAEKTREAIVVQYIKGEEVDNDSMGALAEVLYFDIVEGEVAEKIAHRLAKKVREEKYIHKVGILGMKALLNALSKYGYTDIAYQMVHRFDYPSYGYWMNCGATTLWENWDGSGSRNHHMYSDVINWMFRNVVGIKNGGIAYESCVLEPYFFDKNCNAGGTTETPFGKLGFSWKKQGTLFEADVMIPEGISAYLRLPGRDLISVKNGEKILLTVSET